MVRVVKNSTMRAVIYAMPLSNGKSREKKYNDSHALCNGVNAVLLPFQYFSFSFG